MTATAAKVQEVVNACATYGHQDIIVLSGVPATGKTHISRIAAETVAGHPGFVRRTQFHPGYSYEDFMEGLRPLPTGGYQVEDGVFLQWNRMSLADPANKYVLLIEELSRADIPSVMGELMTFIEHRSESFVLPVSQSSVEVSDSLIVIATMNPRDRSALEIDEAMARRLRVIDCPPDIDQLAEMLTKSLSVQDDEVAEIIQKATTIFTTCESEFPETYLSDMPFGHAIFDRVESTVQLVDLWHQRIKRILYRSQGLTHPFADVIDATYPWKSR
ncbi:AAA family ATPase [Smaragdicoccus niigatensis]|uniref:AAA family ATPase n=1 Tax=Smaragdicoccus niigatensis TaxID=359359 RepID=UPI00036CA22E|nr:AAA family ATPase [Smaragdicoccus niigatensis]